MTEPINPAPAGPPTPTPVDPAPVPAPTPAPFDPATLSPEARAWLESEQRRIAAEEGAKARTQSKANAAAEAQRELLAKLGLKPDTPPEDAAKQLEGERAARRNDQITYGVRDAAREADANVKLLSAYLASEGRLANLDPAAPDFEDKVKGLINTALAEQPSLKLVTTPAVPPPGGSAPGGSVPGGPPAPQRRSADYGLALQKHYAPKTQ